MPLESLSNEQINIHDLTLEQEKKPEMEWQKHYESLKETALYDSNTKQWNLWMREDQSIQSDRVNTDAQMLGIIIKSKIENGSATNLYENLKKGPLFSGNYWIEGLNKNQQKPMLGIESRHYPAEQLLDILTQLQFDPESAKSSYEILKKTRFCEKSSGFWKDPDLMSHELPAYDTDSQLLGIILEAQFDKDKAGKKFENLKNYELFDKKNNQWRAKNYRNSEGAHRLSEQIDTKNQLLGVLCEAQFDKPAAQKLFDNLKNTSLYDKERSQWNLSLGTISDPLLNTMRRSFEQLLGIMCEREFEEEALDLQISAPNLPETRSY